MRENANALREKANVSRENANASCSWFDEGKSGILIVCGRKFTTRMLHVPEISLLVDF